MTAITQTPIITQAQLWKLEDLQELVKDFMNASRRGDEWEDVDEAIAGRYNYAAIGEYILRIAHSDKYRDFISLNYREIIDGGKEDGVIMAYYHEGNGDELGRLKIKRA